MHHDPLKGVILERFRAILPAWSANFRMLNLKETIVDSSITGLPSHKCLLDDFATSKGYSS